MLECPCCYRSYPIVADVPVMFSDATVVRGPLLPPAVVRTVLSAMGLPPEPGTALRVRRASGFRAVFGDNLFAAEGAPFLRRVHASGYPVPVELLNPPDAEPHASRTAEPALEAQPNCRWVLDYIPRAMRPGEPRLANVRFENTGNAPMRHTGHGRIAIAFTWSNEAGDAVRVEDYRTPLPVDLAPGWAITLPVRLIPPPRPGRYRLVLRMVMEDVRWLETDYGPLLITVRHDADFVPPPHWQLSDQPPGHDLADQPRGIELLRVWLDRRPGPHPLRLLEIGGNARPAVAQLTGEAYNIDVDLLGLQVGCVAQRVTPGNPVCFVCADAHHPPFPEGFFDAIVMFASLHHMPDPAALLRRLRIHLRPGGFIGLFCEPIGHSWAAADEGDADELRNGLKERGFILSEYAQIFARAGLWAADLVAHPHSLKARLIPSAESETAHG